MQSFERTLNQICHDARLELHWLNLLSFLEYVGCRKILKSVPYQEVTVDVLQHIFEEAFHAYSLKKFVSMPWEDGLFTMVGWEYFQRLDEEISRHVVPSYSAVSWAVEERVLNVYPLYLKETRRADVRIALGSILNQEKRHAKQFSSFESDLLREIEEVRWKKFQQDLTAILIKPAERCRTSLQPAVFRLHDS